MAVYVDDAFIPWRRGVWCHMQADSLDELHEFAARLGMKREWFQPGSRPETAHYDVTKTRRALAVKLGAIEETTRQGSERRRAAARRRLAA
jgi:hypothetical protein